MTSSTPLPQNSVASPSAETAKPWVTAPPTPIAELAGAIATLSSRKQAWAQLPIPERLAYLQECLVGVAAVAEEWATAACKAKGIDPQASLAGEEWIAGPVATLLNLRLLIQTLEAGGQPQPVALNTRPDGQQVATVFPDNLYDRLMWLGFRGEVWIEPCQPASQGKIYRQQSAPSLGTPPKSSGQLALVLGAGNIAAIAPMDFLYKLFAENHVVLLKLNPVNEYLGTYLEKAFYPLIFNGFLKIVYGGAEVGRYLCNHPDIETIHITGAQQTHDAIVWGPEPAEQQARKAANTPLLTKPITSELGSVTPVIVVPGDWSAADIAFQAQHVASMVAHNASFNCVAAKVLVTAKGWKHRDEFLHAFHCALANTAPRQAYYPGAQQRYQAFCDRYPQAQPYTASSTASTVPWTVIPDVPNRPNEYALTTEAFCGVIAEVALEGHTAADFLPQAVQFANQTLWGNLSCVLLVDGKTQRRYKPVLEEAIAQLQFGAIGLNVWTGMGFLLASTTWGAFPGNSLHDIQSGRGVVHNTYLFDHPQKSVIRAPFRIFPKPIWFANHQNLRQVAQRFARFQQRPSWPNFVGIVWAALKG
jgi:acyl-CoA reductase-like NAD-dependent aldehyde dehydrogenase